MTNIVVRGFAGELPRITETELPANAAQIASNCNIVRGSLKAFRKPNKVYELITAGQIGTIYLYRENDGTERWCEWTQDVDVQPGPIAGDTTKRTYYTGTDTPRVFDDTLVDTGGGSTYPKSSYKLGIPKPTTAPTAVKFSDGGGASRTCTWVYTYVRKWASGKTDEGVPSDPSNSITYLDGGQIDLSTIATAPVGHGITHVWIYRIKTGTAGAEYQFVKEISNGTATTSETVADASLLDVLESEDYDVPPDDMKGLLMLPNGVAVGFSGNEICFSVPYQVHAFPVDYRHAVPYKIVGIKNIGLMVVAATEGYAYTLNGQDPAFASPDRDDMIYPCLSKNGMVSSDPGVIYPSHDGLVLITPGGKGALLTEAIFSREEWDSYYPSTIRAVSYRNRYGASFHNGGDADAISNDSFMLDHNDPASGVVGAFGGSHCLYVDHINGNFYYAATDSVDGKNYVYQWDAQVARVSYLWKSKKFVLPEDTNFGVAQIFGKWTSSLTQAEIDSYNATRDAIIAANQAALAANESGAINGSAINEEEINGDSLQEVPPLLDETIGMTFKLYADGVLVATITVVSDEPFRLPSGYLARVAEIELQGQIEVQKVKMAPSFTDLAYA